MRWNSLQCFTTLCYWTFSTCSHMHKCTLSQTAQKTERIAYQPVKLLCMTTYQKHGPTCIAGCIRICSAQPQVTMTWRNKLQPSMLKTEAFCTRTFFIVLTKKTAVSTAKNTTHMQLYCSSIFCEKNKQKKLQFPNFFISMFVSCSDKTFHSYHILHSVKSDCITKWPKTNLNDTVNVPE